MNPKIKEVVGTVAPALAAALGGPLAGLAARTVSTVLLGREGATEAELAAAVADASPDQLLLLKKADLDFKARMAELEVDLERIAAGDRDSARMRETVVKDRVPATLALLTLIAFFGYIGLVTFSPLAVVKSDFINLALGWLGGSASTVIAYYFGSSAGRDRKLNEGLTTPAR